MLCALIMAGGKGTRFWPLSTEEKPKQFLKLLGNETMIQMTINRIKPIIPIERIFICTVSNYIDLVQSQLPEVPRKNIIIEPESKNTAPAILLSSIIIKRKYKESNIVVLPSDHLIKDEEKFRNIILSSNKFLNDMKESILTIGMKPDRAETGYGYIRFGKESMSIEDSKFMKVDKFVEKPNKEKAEEYLQEENYLWNSGMFLWNVNTIINKIKEYCPNVYYSIRDIEYIEEDKIEDFIKRRYSESPNISIDYAVLEKCTDRYVILGNIGWDDIGTWKSIERYKKKDINNNIIEGNARVIESKSNIAISNEKQVIMIGIEDVMTIETEGCIYIVNKKYMDELRKYKNL